MGISQPPSHPSHPPFIPTSLLIKFGGFFQAPRLFQPSIITSSFNFELFVCNRAKMNCKKTNDHNSKIISFEIRSIWVWYKVVLGITPTISSYLSWDALRGFVPFEKLLKSGKRP